MSLSEHPFLFSMLVVLTANWIIISGIFAGYALRVRLDAVKDVKARHTIGINNGREILAKLVRTMGTLQTIAFIAWFLSGLYAVSPWSLNAEGPAWRRLIFPVTMNIGLMAIAANLFIFHHERQRVLHRDTQAELDRIKAQQQSAAAAVERNTESRDALTNATEDLTRAIRERQQGTD